jgi:mannose-6-phosphate isomerase
LVLYLFGEKNVYKIKIYYVNIYPLKFKPIYKKRIWGGQKLREFFGREIPHGENIGESWDLVDLPDDKSVVANGPFAGYYLSDVIKKFPKEITGKVDFLQPFPLLIKFLDAQDILSVQVHPDKESCLRLGEGDPKTEFWYIISARPDSFIYKGLKEGVDKKQLGDAIKQGTVTDLLVKVPVSAGQCHFLPAGTLHSIGAGLLIAEIQTPSDTTYRVFDFNRLDENGQVRQLHLHQALESINYKEAGFSLPATTEGRLVECRYFTIDKCRQAAGSNLILPPEQMLVMIFITGFGKILSQSEQVVEFKAGDCMIIPSACKSIIQPAIKTEYLKVRI